MVTLAWVQKLLAAARQARAAAYAPYSGFTVGASVLTKTGRIFPGCNIENASFGATVCAERVAIFTAIAAGEQELLAMAVVADIPTPVVPCGLCRQVLVEFSPACLIIMGNLIGQVEIRLLSDLFPQPFSGPGLPSFRHPDL